MKNSTPSALKYALVASAVACCTALSAETSTSTSRTTTTSSAVAPATTDRMATDTSDLKLKHSDRSFLEKAAKSGIKEVEISQGTLDHLNNPQVKSFAQMMVSDHSQANQELMALAARKGVTLPSKEYKYEEKWSKKATDKDLDEDYIKQMVDDHEDAVKLFEKAAKSDDADIAAFAQKTLPTLEHHLTMARDLKKMVK